MAVFLLQTLAAFKTFKDDVKSVLRILSAHNKNNCRGPTVGILIKLKL